jgi:DNA-binding PadR family transcriptional regulator
VSVRDGLLAILTLGPAYGLQLHSELASRAPHRGPVNVGQIYSTLERLTGQGLIESAGQTSDGLPLHRLTDAGVMAVDVWKSDAALDALPEWTEMLDQVLIATTLDPVSAMRLVESYRRWWTRDRDGTRASLAAEHLRTDARLALLARETQAVAALAWLGAASDALADFDTHRPYSPDKPKRGRRPRPAAKVRAR